MLTVVILAVMLAATGAAEAQQPARAHRIGVLRSGAPPDPHVEAFREGLRDLGYREGQEVVLEYRYAEGKEGRLPELAAELARLRVDVIFTSGTRAIEAARQVTGTIPIVFGAAGDPVATGLVASLARPGGNITGISLVGLELTGKRLELIKETAPKASRVAILYNVLNRAMEARLAQGQMAAKTLGVQIQALRVHGPDEFDEAFAAMARERAGALVMVVDPFTLFHRQRLAELVAKHRLPTISEGREFVEVGGLMSYGPSLRANFRRAAALVDKIFKGAKPADLPVEQPTRFELVINMKTAKALGLTIPPSVLIRADQVIQ